MTRLSRLSALLFAAAMALAPASAFAQSYTYSPNQGGAVGSIVSATDPAGNTRKVVLPSVGCINCSGSSYTVTGGTAGGPANLFTPGGGSDGTNYRMFKLDPSSSELLVKDATVAAAINSPIPTQAPTVNIGAVGISQTTPGTTNAVQPIAGTTGGATGYGLQTAASTNSTSVKGAAGVLYGLNLINTTTTIYYLRMYDAASAPTCSSATNFVRTWPVPPAAASGGAGGIAASLPISGVQFSNGIAFCVTGGPSSTDNTNAATGVFINLDYK